MKRWLSGASPNPSATSANVRFVLGEDGYTELVVVNNLGLPVATLVAEFRESGTYTLRFDASSHTSGLYHVILRHGVRQYVKHMSIVR